MSFNYLEFWTEEENKKEAEAEANFKAEAIKEEAEAKPFLFSFHKEEIIVNFRSHDIQHEATKINEEFFKTAFLKKERSTLRELKKK